MIFDSLRDRITVSIDIPKRRKKSTSAQVETPSRKRRLTPQKAKPHKAKRVVETKRPVKRTPSPRSTPDTRSYRSTNGGLFYATGRDGSPQGYPRLSGVGHTEKKHQSTYAIEWKDRNLWTDVYYTFEEVPSQYDAIEEFYDVAPYYDDENGDNLYQIVRITRESDGATWGPFPKDGPRDQDLEESKAKHPKRLSGVETRKGGRTFFYWIDLDERGYFQATVYNPQGKEVLEIPDAEEMELMIDHGFMRHGRDINGLEEYLKDMGVMAKSDKLVYGDWASNQDDAEEDEDDDEEDGSLADSFADLAGITDSELEVANKINERLEYFDDVFHDPIRVFCTKSKKNPYMVRRLVLDCNSESAMNRGGRGRSETYQEVANKMSAVHSLYRQIGMGPKSRAKYFPKHYGVTWEYIVNMSNKQFTVKNRIQEHLEKQATKNAEKATAISAKRSEREARIAEVRREREAKQAAQAERIAKRREEREAKRKPVVEAAPPQPKPAEVAPASKPKPERKPRKPKVSPAPSGETVRIIAVPPIVPSEKATTELTSEQMQSIETDMQNLIALLQTNKKS